MKTKPTQQARPSAADVIDWIVIGCLAVIAGSSLYVAAFIASWAYHGRQVTMAQPLQAAVTVDVAGAGCGKTSGACAAPTQ
jgi:hypothetical protein